MYIIDDYDEEGNSVIVPYVCHVSLDDESLVDEQYWFNAISEPVIAPEEDDIEGIT